MKIDLLKHTLTNICKSVCYGKGKVERKFFKTIVENMLEYKTTVLSKMGDTKEKTAKELRNYYTQHLGKEDWKDLTEKVKKIMIKLIGKINEDSMACFDTVDINKNSAKKMEKLKIVRDGSTGKYGNGYVFHGVTIKGIPIFLEREELESKDKNKGIKYEIFEGQILELKKIFGNGYWILADRYYDDYKKFKLLIENEFNFAIRIKTNRIVKILEGEKAGEFVKVGKLKKGMYKVRIRGIEEDLCICVKKMEGQKTPIRVISNIYDEKIIGKYLERWEIERLFKTGKQEYDLEKIGTKEIQKTDNLVSLVQLCLGISNYIYNQINPKYNFGEDRKESVSMEKMFKKIKPFLKEKALTLNRNSITNFLAYYMKFIRKMKFYFSRPTLNVTVSSQLCLNL